MQKPNLIKRMDRTSWLLHNDRLSEGQLTINWEKLRICEKGSRYQRQLIRSNAKEYLEAVILWREERLGAISARSIRNRFLKLCTFVEWMSKRGVWRFCDLSPDLLAEFMQRIVAGRRSNPTQKTVQAWCAMITDMWLVRERCRHGLRFDPAMHESFRRWSNVGGSLSRWMPLKEQFAVPLIKDAIDWSDRVGPMLVPILERFWEQRQTILFKSRSSIRRATARYFESISVTPGFTNLIQEARLQERAPYEAIREVLRLTLGAVVTLVLFLCGLRVSELVSLRCGCMVEHTHSGGYKYAYVEGKVAKSNGRRHRWVVPAPVCRALALIERLFAFLGDERPGLLLSPVGNGSLPRRAKSFRQMSEAHAAILLRNFARSTSREHPCPKNMRLHPHQGRKTFARFAVSRDKRALEALAQHYGHVHSAITDRAYVGVDMELMELLDRAGQEDLASRLMDLVSADVVGGRAGSSLQSAKSRHLSTISFRGKRALTSLVDKLISDGVKLAPCSWGYCVYVEQLSACHGDSSGPNETERSPDVCSRCSNFAVTAEHRSWWEERFRADEAFLRQPSLPDQTRRFVVQRLDRTISLLRQINSGVFHDSNKEGVNES